MAFLESTLWLLMLLMLKRFSSSLSWTQLHIVLKLDNIANHDVEVLRSLLSKETMTYFHLTDCHLDANHGLSGIESSLIDYVPGTTHQPCTYLKHFGFFSLRTDDGDVAAETYASVLTQCTSIKQEHRVRQLWSWPRRKWIDCQSSCKGCFV